MKLRNAGDGARKPAARARAVPPLERQVLALFKNLNALSQYDRSILSEDIGDEHILTYGDVRDGVAATHSLVLFELGHLYVKGTPRHAAVLNEIQAHISLMVSTSTSEYVHMSSRYYFKVTPAFLENLKAAIIDQAMTTR